MGVVMSKLTGRDTGYSVVLLLVALRYVAWARSRGRDALRGSVLTSLHNLVFSGQTLLRARPNSFSATVLGDAMGLCLVWRGLKLLRGALRLRFKSKAELFNDVGGFGFRVVNSIPMLRGRVEETFAQEESKIEAMLKDPDREITMVLPDAGQDGELILSSMRACATKENKKWMDGKVSGCVYHGDPEHIAVLNAAYNAFSVSNPLHPDVWPTVMKYEAEVVQMTASLLNGGDDGVCGCISSGGTESIILAVKTHREWARIEKGIEDPEIIVASTVHAAFDKACDILCVKLIKIPVDTTTFRVDPRAVRRRLSSNTILIVGSAPNYPQGTIDPIEELSAIALQHGCGLHVDCCLGGFVLPFARELGYDLGGNFDFGVKGVTSMSCDTHKYGYALKGTSVVLYRSKALRRHQYFTYPQWTGGLYCTPTIAGSKAGGVVAATWASMMRLGHSGFRDEVSKIMSVATKIKAKIGDIPGIHVMGEPKAMVVAFEVDDSPRPVNVYSISDAMAKKGWSLNALQKPASVHICVTKCHTNDGVCDTFLSDLSECVGAAVAAANDPNAPPSKEGNAPVYGMAESLPPGPLNSILCSYMDVVLKP
jgi:glutamate/tyrosine decarboxylase-like PLP-dependent enzyme